MRGFIMLQFMLLYRHTCCFAVKGELTFCF